MFYIRFQQYQYVMDINMFVDLNVVQYKSEGFGFPYCLL